MLSPSKLASLVPLVFVLASLAACGSDTVEEEPPPTKGGSVALISFEIVAYLDPAAQSARILERVRRETESVVAPLRKQEISITRKRQVDVDIRNVIRDPVTVVDPEGGARRPALRVRYWFVGFADLPADMPEVNEIPFGLLHAEDESRAQELAPCLSSSPTGAPLWQRFDPTTDACRQAIDAEQKAITEARQRLHSAPQEILPIEQARLFVPIALYLKPQGAKVKPAIDPGAPSAAAAGERPVVGGANPYEGRGNEGLDPSRNPPMAPGYAGLDEKLRERERAQAEAEETKNDDTHSKVRRPVFVGGDSKSKSGDFVGYTFVASEPSLKFLFLLVPVVLGIAANEIRRQRRKRSRR